ncbi:hypothetical protein HB364_09085 [Pseudoflavitalea sp. X16]|uniref:hypothetical protein n=1 Tax=Paraflavitalea devenefica TaxID=2716334 RepID=UPI001423DA78|nr:hypothetical protein [Paraflavitalea devenefica]NII25233.1 hypothetical protein [Paraflavitalea devenefica]
MGIALFFLIVFLGVVGLVSYGISRGVHARLVRAGNSYATVITIATFVLIFSAIIAGTIAALSTVEWGR